MVWVGRKAAPRRMQESRGWSPQAPGRLSAAPALLLRALSAPGAAWVPEAEGPGPEQSLEQRDGGQGREPGSRAESLGSWYGPRKEGSSFRGG